MYRLFVLLIRACVTAITSLVVRATLGMVHLIRFTLFTSRRSVVDSGSSIPIGKCKSRYDLWLYILTGASRSRQCQVAAGGQYNLVVRIWPCRLHSPDVGHGQFGSALIYRSRFVYHGPSSCNHRQPMEQLSHTRVQHQPPCQFLTK